MRPQSPTTDGLADSHCIGGLKKHQYPHLIYRLTNDLLD